MLTFLDCKPVQHRPHAHHLCHHPSDQEGQHGRGLKELLQHSVGLRRARARPLARSDERPQPDHLGHNDHFLRAQLSTPVLWASRRSWCAKKLLSVTSPNLTKTYQT
jgi:hypothetical protein